jgi:hypothetical protein
MQSMFSTKKIENDKYIRKRKFEMDKVKKTAFHHPITRNRKLP